MVTSKCWKTTNQCFLLLARSLRDYCMTGYNRVIWISKNESGFRPSDSCINRSLSITHEIYWSFDDSLEVRAVFLDISKAFDKTWHKGLIFKLKQNGISDKILNIITDFLSFRKQCVILNGQASPWASIEAGGCAPGFHTWTTVIFDLH